MRGKFITVFGEEVHLNREKFIHIKQKHPEVKSFIEKIPEVLKLPDLVKLSKKDAEVHLYYKFYNEIFGGKHLLVVTNSKRKTILTVFVTDKIKVGETIWQKK